MIRRLSRAALVLATVLLGLWAQTARQLDELHVHVVCPDHGELIEQASHIRSGVAQITGQDASAHNEGCLLAWAAPAGAIATPPPPIAIEHPDGVDSPATILTASAGVSRPPLRDAPKTSPPRA